MIVSNVSPNYLTHGRFGLYQISMLVFQLCMKLQASSFYRYHIVCQGLASSRDFFFLLLDLNAKNVLLHSYISFPLAVVYIYCTFLFEIVTTFQAKIFVWLWFKKWYKFKILLSSFSNLRTIIFLLNFIHFYSFSNKCTFK